MAFTPIPDPATLLSTVFNMERQIATLEQQLAAARNTATSADGTVTAVASGTPRLETLTIAPAALTAATTANDMSILTSKVITVVNQAMGAAQDASAAATATVAAGLTLPGICGPSTSFPTIASFPETAAALEASVPVIDQKIVARLFQGVVGPVTATVNGHFEVTSLVVTGFPADPDVLAEQMVRAINLANEQEKKNIDDAVSGTVVDPGTKVNFQDLCLLARGALRLADRGITIVNSSGAFAAIGNAGGTETNIGVGAQVGNVWSAASVTLRNNATVNGFVKTSGSFTSQTTPPGVTGGIFSPTLVQLPVVSLQVNFPTNPQPAISLEPPKPGDPIPSATPGGYAGLTLKSGATLKLSTGTYTFGNFDLEPSSTLLIDSRSGRVIIHVQSGNLIFRGAFKSVTTSRPDVFLGYFGTGGVTIESLFTGTLVAPTANITLATVPLPGHSGAFFGQDIQINPDNKITFFPYTGSPVLGTL